MGVAVCVRCGSKRADYRQICPSCGHRPEAEGLLVAWLLSDNHLDDDALEAASRRVREGESIRPSERMLDKARRALGTHIESDPGLSGTQRLALLATSLLLTPLPGWVLFAWWIRQRPRAALQALALSFPATVLFAGVGLWMRITG